MKKEFQNARKNPKTVKKSERKIIKKKAVSINEGNDALTKKEEDKNSYGTKYTWIINYFAIFLLGYTVAMLHGRLEGLNEFVVLGNDNKEKK